MPPPPYPFSINGRFILQSVTGVQRVARELLSVFDDMAVAGRIAPPRLLMPAKGDMSAPLDLKAIRVERGGRLSGHAWEQIDLPRMAGPEPLLCLGNTAPLPRLLASRKPVVTMVHDLSYKYFPAAYDWKFRALYGALIPVILRNAEAVVTVSEAERRAIEAAYPALAGDPRLSFLQNGGLSDTVAQRVAAEPVAALESRGYGLYVGSLTRRKNAEGLLRAAIAFLEAYPQMRFVVIGASGASFEGVDVSVPAHLAERLEFRGQINDAATIHEAYRGARFLLFPSFYEASPLPPIEAMSFGCPALVSRIPSLTERCGEAAIYFAPEDQAQIAAAIRGVMDDPARWRDYSERARAQAARYSWRAQAEGLIALCEGLR